MSSPDSNRKQLFLTIVTFLNITVFIVFLIKYCIFDQIQAAFENIRLNQKHLKNVTDPKTSLISFCQCKTTVLNLLEFTQKRG